MIAEVFRSDVKQFQARNTVRVKRNNTWHRLYAYILSATLVSITSAVLYGCESCDKYWTFTGVVRNSADNQPIEGALVIGPPSGDRSGIATAVTDAEGKYNISARSFGGLDGFKVNVEKPGFVSTESLPLSLEEAGIERCGSVAITRDMSMTPE